MTAIAPAGNVGWQHFVFCALLVLIGLFLAIGGAWLAALGGSFYYLITGVLVLATAWLLYKGRLAGVWVYAFILVYTLIWSFWELGADFWGVFPRIAGPAILGIWLALPFVWRKLR